METSAIVIIAAIIVAIVFVNGIFFVFILRRMNEQAREAAEEKKNDQSYVMLQNQLQNLTRSVSDQLSESSKRLDSRLSDTSQQMNQSTKQIHDAVRSQLGESAKIVQEVTEGLTKLGETNKQVISFADQLQSLQDVLKNPKQRGILGEYYLESVLKNVLPPGRFQMQYKFDDGEIVDAVIFLDDDKILPIDSKFSLENYNRILDTNESTERDRLEKLFKQDLKTRIDETSKYIRPKNNTMDFAFMFIPSEGVYYDLLINQVGIGKASARDLIEYAFQQKKVIIVSPTSFLAYLQTVMQGLRALQIEESAKDIRKRVEELGRHMGNYDQFMDKLGNSLGTTVNAYNSAYKELGKIDKDVMRITGETTGIDVMKLDKPNREE